MLASNNWQNILDKIQSIFRNEFKNSFPVYIGDNKKAGSQYFRIEPIKSVLSSRSLGGESREYFMNLYLYYPSADMSKVKSILKLVTRVENLVYKNSTFNLEDDTRAIDYRVTSTELISNPEESLSIVLFSLVVEHTSIF